MCTHDSNCVAGLANFDYRSHISLVNEQLIIIFTRIIVTLTHNRANYNFSNTVASLSVLWPA